MVTVIVITAGRAPNQARYDMVVTSRPPPLPPALPPPPRAPKRQSTPLLPRPRLLRPPTFRRGQPGVNALVSRR